MRWHANRHICTHTTQHAPGRSEMNPGQEMRPAAVCNYLAFHRPRPPPPPTNRSLSTSLSSLHRLRPSTPPPVCIRTRPAPNFTLSIFSFFFFFCCCEVLTSNRAGHYPGAEGDYWCLATSEETVMETKTGSEGRAWQERRAACMCVFSPPFSSSRVKVLISVAGTVPASPICHAALSARQNERKER